MVSETKDMLFAKVDQQLLEFLKIVDEKIDKEQKQLKACKKKTELETKLAQEIKLNNELMERLAELTRHSTELDRVCESLASISIAESDQHKLDNAKENYQVAKELTGIRFDFTAPPNIAKGYIKNESRKLLQPFQIDITEGNNDALWTVIESTIASGWQLPINKENIAQNIAKTKI